MNLKEQNVLFITRTMHLGGTENVILQLCEILKEKVNKIVVCSSGGVNVQKLTVMGIQHYKIPDITDKKPLTVLQITRILRNIMKEEHITIVHSHHRMAALYAVMVCNRQILRIAHAHNTFQDKKILTKIAYWKTNIIAVGKQVENNLTQFYKLPPSSITIIHNTVKPFTQPIIPVSELENAHKQGCILIGNIGRLSQQKGMEYFIEASEIVFRINPMVRFFIVGDGEDSELLKKMSEERFPAGILTFLGYRCDIQNIMSQLDFIVLSSLWEGFPLTPIEAFSTGKTIVATAVDGTPEIVADNRNGILVRPKDSKAIANGMIKIINDNVYKKNLEENAAKTYQENFSFSEFCRAVVMYYSKLSF